MSVDLEAAENAYSAPDLTRRSREQATLFLVGHAWIGDAGARDLLDLLFLDPNPE